jgi:hypothetical protein
MAAVFAKNPQVVKSFPRAFLKQQRYNENPSPSSEGFRRLNFA